MKSALKSAFAFLLVSGFGCIGTPASADGGGTGLTIKRITVLGGQFFLSGTFPNPDGCVSSAVIAVVPNDVNRDMWLALATSAQLSRRKVSVWLSGCSYSPWYSTFPTLTALTLEEE